MHQHIGLLTRNHGYCGERIDRFGHLLLEPLEDHHFRLNVHLPTGQLGSQPGILPALTNGQGKLVFANHDPDPFAGFIDFESFKLCRCQCVGDEIPDVRVPADDVHLLVVEFPHDVLDPLAAQSDAGTYRINLFVPGPDCQLGAKARFAGNALDLNRAVLDLGHFQLEELDDKPRIGAGQNDLGPVRSLLDCADVAAEALADLVFFGRDALTVGQQGLVLAQIYDDI